MTVSLRLGSYLYSCPASWVNFIEDLRERGIEQTVSEGFSLEVINRELSPYSAVYLEYTDNFDRATVDFYDEKCYTLFVLTYGGKQ